MTCEEVRRTIDLYLDGEFGIQEKARIEQHLAECPTCRAFATRQYHLKQGIRTAFAQVETPFRLRQSIQDGIARQAAQRMLHLGMSLAAVFIIAGLMLWLLLRPAAMTPTAPQIVQTREPSEVHLLRPPSLPSAGRPPESRRPAPPAFAPVNYTP